MSASENLFITLYEQPASIGDFLSRYPFTVLRIRFAVLWMNREGLYTTLMI